MRKNTLSQSIKMIKNFRHRSLFFKYIKTLILIILIPSVLLNVCIYTYITTSGKNDIKRESLSRIDFLNNTANSFFNDMDSIYYSIINDYYASQFFTHDIYSPDYPEDVAAISQNINSILNSAMHNKYPASSVHIYSEKNNYVFMQANGCFLEQYENPWWLDEYKRGCIQFFRETENAVSFGYTVLDKNIKPSGAIIISFNKNELKYFFGLKENESIVIKKDNFNLTFDEESLPDSVISSLSEGDKNIIVADDRAYVQSESQTQNFTIYACFAAIDKNTHAIRLYMLATILFTILVVLVIAFLGSLVLYRSIAKVISLLETSSVASEEDMEKEYNEIMYVQNSIINLINNDKKAEEQLVEKMQNIKKYQTITLQAQINPHFLFNTLNLINTELYSIFKCNNNITKTITTLADIVHSSLAVNDYIIPLSEEVVYAKKYAEILNYRYENLFEISWNIAPDTENIPVIKMILQPIIENAVEHGILILPEDVRGVIKISSSLTNNTLCLKVENNGKGIAPDRLKKIKKDIKDQVIGSNHHIGLSNINKRINLIYGDSYGVDISSDENTTVVIITLPSTHI